MQKSMKMNEKKKITGIFSNNGNEYSFVMSDFEITILYNGKNIEEKEIIPEEGYIHVESYDCKRYLIAISKSVKIIFSVNVIFDFYIESYNDMISYEFSGIEFLGGSINDIIAKNRLGIPKNKKGVFEVPYDENEQVKKYNIQSDNLTAVLTLNSLIDATLDFEEGKEIIADGNKYIELHLELKLNEVVKHFNYIIRIIKILTYRDNVGDFKTFLLKEDKRVAECHYKFRNMYKSNKRRGESICLDWLNEEQINKLFSVILKSDKYGFSIDFLQTDEKMHDVEKERIINLVTGIESLLNIIQEDFASKHAELIKSLKSIINNDSSLDVKEKNDINGYISHINKGIKDRIKEEFNKNKETLEKWMKLHAMEIDNRDSIIDDMIEYRNHHVHNDIGDLTPELANNSTLFDIMIYCFLLKYIGLDEKKIEYILEICIV